MLIFGKLGDLYGQRRIFCIGLIASIFALLLISTADSFNLLLFFRFLQGVGIGLVTSVAPAMMIALYPEEKRAYAVGLFTLFFALGGLLGPIIGGVLINLFDWRAVFWINPPIIALAMVLSILLVPNSRDIAGSPMDPIGGALSVGALGFVLFAIIEGPSLGWRSREVLALGAMGVVLSFLFVWWERKTEHPMLPIGFFQNRGFSLGLIAISLAFFVMFSFMFTQMLHFQLVRERSAFEAALR